MPRIPFVVPPYLITPMPTLVTNSFRCYQCGRISTSADCIEGPSNTRLCRECFTRECFRCPNCNRLQRVSGAREHQGDRYCERCYRSYVTWDAGVFNPQAVSYDKIRSDRKYGVELETSSCQGYIDDKTSHIFGAKFDCSVGGMEFTSPILYGDEGLLEVEKFCSLAADKGYTVDSDCGYHLHIDMREEGDTALKSVAYAYLKSDSAWRLLVDSFRANDCGYCRPADFSRNSLERATDMDSWCDNWNRYSLCNLNAYPKFGSYEIRLHQGSVNAREICNWIKAHLRFVDWAKGKTLDEIDDAFGGSIADRWESLKAIFGDIDLNRYYGRIRRSRLGTRRQAATVSS